MGARAAAVFLLSAMPLIGPFIVRAGSFHGSGSPSLAMVSVGPLPTVFADGSQMWQVMQNLISNAIKFRDEKKPEITIWANERSGGMDLLQSRTTGSVWTWFIPIVSSRCSNACTQKRDTPVQGSV